MSRWRQTHFVQRYAHLIITNALIFLAVRSFLPHLVDLSRLMCLVSALWLAHQAWRDGSLLYRGRANSMSAPVAAGIGALMGYAAALLGQAATLLFLPDPSLPPTAKPLGWSLGVALLVSTALMTVVRVRNDTALETQSGER